MPVQFLHSSSYAGMETLNPEQVGINVGSHIAAVRFEGDKAPTKAYVKFCGPSEHDLFYEILGYILAQNLGIKQPPRAALIIAPLDLIRKHGGVLPDWIPKNAQSMPAFCTELSPSRSISYLYKADALLAKYQDLFINCHNWYASVTAFDEWLANNDRNGGNILQLSPNVYSIIDHGRLFDNKSPSIIHTKGLLAKNLMRGVITGMGDKNVEKLNNSMALASGKHNPARSKALPSIDKWLKIFNQIDESIVLKFIQERSEANWMEDRVGVI
jgi:hypothetical protein